MVDLIPSADFRAGRLRTRIRILAVVCAALITVAIPACYLTVVYFAQKEALEFQAKLTSGNLARYVYANGPLWVFHVHRLDELLAGVQNPRLETSQAIHDADGRAIHGQGRGCTVPLISVADDIVVNGAGAGRVVVCQSFAPFLWRSLLLLALGACLGALTYVSVQWLPVSALDRTLAELEQAYQRLREQAAQTAQAYRLLQDQHQTIEEQATALAEARDEALTANKAKTNFLSNMSHELRTPLSAIIGFSDLMRNETLGPLPGRYKEYAGDINDSGCHLLLLVDEILDVSRIEAGKVELALSPLDLRIVLSACIRMVRERAIKGQVALVEVLGDAPTTVHGDLTRLKQVFINLLANAVRFTPPLGRVTVRLQQTDGRAVVTIRDTGIGMRTGAPDQAFVVLDASPGSDASGLGLPIAKSLVHLHGGTLVIDSAPGKGTCVTVNMALAEEPLRQVS